MFEGIQVCLVDTDHLNDSPLKFDGMLESNYVVSVGLSDPALASSATSLYSRLLTCLSSVSCLIAGYLSSANRGAQKLQSRMIQLYLLEYTHKPSLWTLKTL